MAEDKKTEFTTIGSLWRSEKGAKSAASGWLKIGDKEHRIIVTTNDWAINKGKEENKDTSKWPNLLIKTTGETRTAWKPENKDSKSKQAPKKVAQAPKEEVQSDESSELM